MGELTTSSEAYFFREELDDESQHFLRQKIELLKNIDSALSSFYNDNYKTVDIDSYKFTVSYAIQCNKEICQQTTDFIFNQDLTKEERETQLTGVLANYYFSLFQLEEIRDIIHNIPSPDNNPFTKLFGQ